MGELVQAFMKEVLGDDRQNKAAANAPYAAAKAVLGFGLLAGLVGPRVY